MKFDKNSFAKYLIDNGVVGFFEDAVTLKSGRRSHWYVNWRKISNDAFLMDKLADFVLDFTSGLGIEADSFYGVPEGATKIGILCTYKHAIKSPNFGVGSHAMPMGRAAPKAHGVPSDRFFVGAPKGKVVVIEDVTTTGGSLARELERLKEAGANVVAAIGLTNRMEKSDDGRSVKDVVAAFGVPYHALSEASHILPLAYASLKPEEFIAVEIEKEFDEYGVVPVRLLD